MKKLSLYIFLGLLWCNVGVAEDKEKIIDPYDPSYEEGITFEELQAKIKIRKRKQAEFRCAHLSGKSKNTWSAKKIYKTCLAKEGY